MAIHVCKQIVGRILYVGIPSFSRVDDGVEYATSVLTSGGKLTRVYGYHYFPSDVVEFTSNNEARDHLALTFKIDKASDSLVICDTGKVPLTRQKQDEGSDDESFISLSVSAPAGDTDGISLPWFDTADAVMMYHFIAHDEALVKLNVGFGENGRKLDVWPAENDRDNKNLLSLTLDNAESDGASRVFTASVPHPPLSSSPSPTYHIRLVLLMFLAPLTILLSGVYMGLVSLVSTVVGLFFRVFWVFAFLFVVRWVHKGRPPVGEFIQEVGDDARSLAERVQTWRSGRSSNRGKDEEQPPLSDEQVKSDPEIERKDVS